MATIADVSADVRELPLRHPFATARDHLVRQVTCPIRIAVRLDDGRTGVGEAVPVTYVTGETQESVLDAVEAARGVLAGGDPLRPRHLTDALREALPDSHSARAGLEMALYGLSAQLSGIAPWHLFGGGASSIRTDITLSIGADIEARIAEAAAQGFDIFKTKVGADLDEGIRQLERIAAAAPNGRVRIDANQAFQPAEAIEFIRRATKVPLALDLVEQPVAARDLDALAAVAERSPVPIYADEAVRTPSEAFEVLTRTHVAGINVKLMKSGVSGALDIVALTRAAGRGLMIGCMLETRLGIGFSVAFACGAGAFEHADLDGHLLVLEEGPNPYFAERGPVLTPAGAAPGQP